MQTHTRGNEERSGGPRARALVAVLLVSLVVGAGLTTVPASAGERRRPSAGPTVHPRPRPGKLSPRLRTVAAPVEFDSRRAEAAALSLPVAGPGSLVRASGDRLFVEVQMSSTSGAALARLESLGAHIVNVSPEYSVVTAAVAPAALDGIAGDPSVAYVHEVLRPVTTPVSASPAPASAAPRAVKPASVCQPTLAEGGSLMNVGSARAANQVDGTGETIGVLSDSFDTAASAPTRAAQDVATGDLPGVGNPCGHTTPVTVQEDYAGGGQTDEGRAMAELAHGIAPGARLAFATAGKGQYDFASQITKLRTANHATVLADDLAYLDEPFFQDGPIAQAANAASAAGVPYFSAAGNDNAIVGGKDVASYEAPAFRSTTCPQAVLNVETLLGCHDFDPSGGDDNTADVTLAAGGSLGIDLQWAQPWSITGTDFDLFLLDESGAVVASSGFDQAHLHEPFEVFGYTNSTGSSQTVRIVIGKYSGTANPRLKYVMFGSSGVTAVQYDESAGGDIVGPTIYGHSGAASVGSTAAIPYDDSNTSEEYSSHGPVTLYFQPTPSTTPLAAPQQNDKPEFAATDGGQSVFFGSPIGNKLRFYGTSAAAPQAAAIGALLMQHDPALSPAQVIATLRATARPVAIDGSVTDVGGGYLDASAALAGVVPLPGAPQITSLANGNGRVTVHWAAAASSPKFPVTRYSVTPNLGGVPQPPRTFNSSNTTQVIAGLTNGATYTFTVEALNTNGAGAESSVSGAIVVGRPGAPTAVSGVPGDASAMVKWAKPATTFGLPITGYEVLGYVGTTLKLDRTFNASVTQRKITGLANKNSYAFSVKAINATSTGLASGLSLPVRIGAPLPPLQVAATPGNGTAFVHWLAPDDNGSPLTRYTVLVFRNGQQQSVVENGTKVSRTFKSLALGGRYTFRVFATNGRGEGPPSGSSLAIIVGAPGRVKGVTATAAHKAAKVEWTAPTANGKAITSYTVTPYVGSVAKSPRVYSGNATARTVSGLTPGQKYTFRVGATNARGAGQMSNPSNAVKVT